MVKCIYIYLYILYLLMHYDVFNKIKCDIQDLRKQKKMK